jgi:hypothetical protein
MDDKNELYSDEDDDMNPDDDRKYEVEGRTDIELLRGDTCIMFRNDGSTQVYVNEDTFDQLSDYDDCEDEEEVSVPVSLINVSKFFIAISRFTLPGDRSVPGKLYREELN